MKPFLLVAVATTLVGAQTPAPGSEVRPFEVVSVKRSPPPANPNERIVRPGSPQPGGRWTAINATLLMILQRAYPQFDKPGLIVDGPDWLTERQFDVEARAKGTPTREQYAAMVRLLLADRFKLKAHVDARPIDVYALVAARADGRLGPRLRPATPECLAELEAERARLAARTGPVTFSTTDAQPCNGAIQMNPPMLRLAGARTLESLAFALQAYMDKRVVDRTGLQGVYEYDLEFDFAATRGIDTTSGIDAGGGSVFTAVQEHLGLKLERRREMHDVLVIDSVEMPSEN